MESSSKHLSILSQLSTLFHISILQCKHSSMVSWSSIEISCTLLNCTSPCFHRQVQRDCNVEDFEKEIRSACKESFTQTSPSESVQSPYCVQAHKHYLYSINPTTSSPLAKPPLTQTNMMDQPEMNMNRMLEEAKAHMATSRLQSGRVTPKDLSPYTTSPTVEETSCPPTPALTDSSSLRSTPSSSPPLSPIASSPPPARLRSLSKLQIPLPRLLPPQYLENQPSPLSLTRSQTLPQESQSATPQFVPRKLQRTNSFKPAPAPAPPADDDSPLSPSPSPFEHLRKHLLRIPRLEVSPMSTTYIRSQRATPISPMSTMAMRGSPSPRRSCNNSPWKGLEELSPFPYSAASAHSLYSPVINAH